MPTWTCEITGKTFDLEKDIDKIKQHIDNLKPKRTSQTKNKKEKEKELVELAKKYTLRLLTSPTKEEFVSNLKEYIDIGFDKQFSDDDLEFELLDVFYSPEMYSNDSLFALGNLFKTRALVFKNKRVHTYIQRIFNKRWGVAETESGAGYSLPNLFSFPSTYPISSILRSYLMQRLFESFTEEELKGKITSKLFPKKALTAEQKKEVELLKVELRSREKVLTGLRKEIRELHEQIDNKTYGIVIPTKFTDLLSKTSNTKSVLAELNRLVMSHD